MEKQFFLFLNKSFKKVGEIMLPGSFMDLNEYIRVERMNKYAAAVVKLNETNRVKMECLGKKKIDLPVFLVFEWYVKDKRRDKDNIAFSKKFILDGLVAANVIKNDNFKSLIGFLDLFYVSVDQKVVISFYKF